MQPTRVFGTFTIVVKTHAPNQLHIYLINMPHFLEVLFILARNKRKNNFAVPKNTKMCKSM